MNNSKRTVSKGARLLLLWHLRQDGLLEGLTLQEIADFTGHNRSTIMRDLRDLDQVDEEYRSLMATQPWVRREITVQQFASELDWEEDTVRAMIRDGIINAQRIDDWRYRIPRSELERWRTFTSAT